jgi:diguanylate cyclase (GGDEF)-like protein
MLYTVFDNLKAINDKYGYSEGDLALKETAGILKESYRESDIIARIGSDEFALVPVGTAKDRAEIIISRLQKNLAIHNSKKDLKYKLSFSIGIAYYNPKHPSSIDKLLSQAKKSAHEQEKQ